MIVFTADSRTLKKRNEKGIKHEISIHTMLKGIISKYIKDDSYDSTIIN